MLERLSEVTELAGNVHESSWEPSEPQASRPHVHEVGGGDGHGTSTPTGREFLVTVIRPGQALSGRVYTQTACNELARQLEGARAFADHPTRTELRERAERSIRDMVGYYHGVEIGPDGAVRARLRLLEHAGWLGDLLRSALDRGRGDLVGVSIDAIVDVDRDGGGQPKVTGCQKLLSADIVTRPSAGGAVERVVASERERDDLMDPDGLGAASAPMLGRPVAGTDGTPQAPTAEPSAGRRAMGEGSAVLSAGGAVAAHGPATSYAAERTFEAGDLALGSVGGDLEGLRREMREQRRLLEHERRLVACERAMESSFASANLPAPVLNVVRNRFAGRVFEQFDLDAELQTQRELLARLTQDGLIRGMGGPERGLVTAGSMRDGLDRLQEAFDAAFDVHVDGGLVRKGRRQGVRATESIRELYVIATGDHHVAGFGPNIRALEGERVTEADTTTASFSYLLGTSMNRKLLAEYQSWPAEWQKWCTIVPIKDFKQQSRVRLGAFGSLSTVAEDTAYTTLSLADTQATYTATKRGNLVQISRETIINDDLQGVKQIPTKLAIASAYTLAEFVYNFVLSTSNPNIYDGFALFDNVHHANYGSGLTLSTANVETGVIAMRKQTNSAGKRLGVRPAFLIVPPELEFTALTIVRSAGIPGSNNNDINPMMGYMDVLVSPQLTAAAQWILSADPRVIDTVEVGFVGGQVNPELFIQDNPLYGLNFTQDVISYKVRHEYGGAVVDYRGVYSGF